MRNQHVRAILESWLAEFHDGGSVAVVSADAEAHLAVSSQGRQILVAQPGVLSSVFGGAFPLVDLELSPSGPAPAHFLKHPSEEVVSVHSPNLPLKLPAADGISLLHQLVRAHPRKSSPTSEYVLAIHNYPPLPNRGDLTLLMDQEKSRNAGVNFVERTDRYGGNGDLLAEALEARSLITSSVRWALLARLLGLSVRTPHGDVDNLGKEEALGDLLRHHIFYDPIKSELCSFEDTCQRLLFWRREEAAHDLPTFCVGMSRWKRHAVSAFLSSSRHRPHFVQAARAAAMARSNNGRVVVWASKVTAALREDCASAGVPLELMEDGFLRSRGLGSHRVPPMSLVHDKLGIYFDPARPSEIEETLETTDIPPELLVRARAFRERIVSLGASKYNVGNSYLIPVPARTQKVILVPGQVADDASLRLGSGAVSNNWDLLQETRNRNPHAFIIYKPHPDVEHSRRAGFIPHHQLLKLADYVASGLASEKAIEQAHEVWTITSLLGFEALIREKTVVCFGLPFYAGWGLTSDEMRCPRRTRSRTLDELVAATYFLYPRYIDTQTGLRMTAEDALDRLFAPAPLSRRRGSLISRILG